MLSTEFPTLIRLVTAAVAVALVAGCSDDSALAGSEQFLGLSSACLPVDADQIQTASPGLIELADGETLSDLTFHTEGSLPHSVALALSGYAGGDVIPLSDDAELLEAESFDLEGPGSWPIVVLVPLSSEPGDVSIEQITYTVGGVTYFSSDVVFVFRLEERCF